MVKISLPSREKTQPFHETLFSLNLALAFCYALTSYCALEVSYSKDESKGYPFFYCLLRGAVRINEFLHLHYSNPTYGGRPNPGSPVGVDLSLAVLMIGVAIVLLLLLHFAAATRLRSLILNPLGGLSALFALPLSYLFVLSHTWKQDVPNGIWATTVPELLGVMLVFLVCNWRPLSAWIIGLLMVLHYGFWLTLLLSMQGASGTLYGPIPPRLWFLIFPFAGAAWLGYLRSQPQQTATKRRNPSGNIWLCATSAIALALLAMVWLPGHGYGLGHAKCPGSLSIKMWRTNYTITIHANGLVEYIGGEFVRDRGPEVATLSQDEVDQILRDLDRADFFALEDRAFAWGFDSPRVTVRITIDGRTKEVSSDTWFFGSKSGQQARFVEATREIDRIVGSDRWAKCDGRPCPP
jgi:Domain of unknown function (DUF6438)